MRPTIPSDPPAVRPVPLLHQEGVLGLLAIVGLALGERGALGGLAPVDGRGASKGPFRLQVQVRPSEPANECDSCLDGCLLVGVGGGLGCSFLLWLIRGIPPLAELQRFQRRLVRDWTVTDAVAVALLSGLAEEALLRALLQPLIGLFPAALLFAALHLVPDRRLWLWPLIALTLGIALGLIFEGWGYPAAAAAHIVINVLALLRLRGEEVEEVAGSR